MSSASDFATITEHLDPDAFAELIAGYCIEVKTDQQVLIRSTTLAEPLLLALQRAVLARDAWPFLCWERTGRMAVRWVHKGGRNCQERWSEKV